jgi:hypothetical protein
MEVKDEKQGIRANRKNSTGHRPKGRKNESQSF